VTRSRTFQVKDVARIAGVSVRTLHHYDAIGLLVPQLRTAAGYRVYTDDDLLRLQQILIGRELGLSLEEIRRSLDDPGFDRMAALLDQRERLQERVQQTEAMIRAVDAALAGLNCDQKDAGVNMEDLFQGFDPSRYEDPGNRASRLIGAGSAVRASRIPGYRRCVPPRHCLFLSSQSIGSHSSTLLPSGSRIQANLPFSAESGPFTGSIPFAFSCASMPSSESTR
jgi:DNA-binding transcriptional MerR regulator